VPSPCFSQRGMNTCAPVFRSGLPPATRLTTSASLGTTMVFSPSLYLSCSVSPSTFCTCCATAPLVMVLLGTKSHGSSGPPQRLLKNVNFNRLLSTIRLRRGGDADERIALYVRHRTF